MPNALCQAVKVEASLDKRFDDAQAWTSLATTAHLEWMLKAKGLITIDG